MIWSSPQMVREGWKTERCQTTNPEMNSSLCEYGCQCVCREADSAANIGENVKIWKKKKIPGSRPTNSSLSSWQAEFPTRLVRVLQYVMKFQANKLDQNSNKKQNKQKQQQPAPLSERLCAGQNEWWEIRHFLTIAVIKLKLKVPAWFPFDVCWNTIL